MKRGIAANAARLDLVGRDVARASALPSTLRRIAPAIIGISLVCALGVVAVRVDLIRVRYGLANAVRQERALLEERRGVLAEVRALREPSRLAKLARERGFVRPARIRTLAPPKDAVTPTARLGVRP
ncbi:MAG: hypothetical protein JRH16_10740 [Deltaproteobacteria bacterium]|nr:hypothetical protein [Deltaproteobacteria bacterium]MBW2360151.1 hypothetical protein [Deltaproteobacteria bacterium]